MVNWNQPGILLEEVRFFKKNRFVDGILKNSIQPITSRIRSLTIEVSPSFTVMGFNNSAFSVSEGATEIIGSPCNRS